MPYFNHILIKLKLIKHDMRIILNTNHLTPMILVFKIVNHVSYHTRIEIGSTMCVSYKMCDTL